MLADSEATPARPGERCFPRAFVTKSGFQPFVPAGRSIRPTFEKTERCLGRVLGRKMTLHVSGYHAIQALCGGSDLEKT